MRQLLIIPFLILLGCGNHNIEETRIPNSEVQEFIMQKKYLALNNPLTKKEISLSYDILLNFLFDNEMNKANFYLKSEGIKKNSNYLTIPIYHYESILVDIEQTKKYEKWKKEKKDDDLNFFPFIKGNNSGKDGIVKIDLQTNEVVDFSLWK